MSKRLQRFLNCPHKSVQEYSECCNQCGENIYTTAAQIIAEEEAEKRRKREHEEWDNSTGW